MYFELEFFVLSLWPAHMKEFHIPDHKVDVMSKSDRISGDTIHVIHSFSQNI